MTRKKIPHINTLRRHRKLMRYNQQDVASILGLKSHAKISIWEKGITLPSLINMFKLSIIYHTLPEVLFSDLVIVLRKEISTRENKYKNKKIKSNRVKNK